MKKMFFKWISKLVEGSAEVFWLAGLVLNEMNEWKVRTVYRNKDTGQLFPSLDPIGMLPLLSLGTWFDRHGQLMVDDLPGELVETIIQDVGNPEVITSDELPPELYPLPEGKAGKQRLFRYRTAKGNVLIPAVELVRFLFLHNRALALALMRPAGLEQLYAPMAPGSRDVAKLQFTRAMPQSAIGHELAKNIAWIALDENARRSWDSVLRLSQGQSYVLFEPPSIRNSVWAFRGFRFGNQWLVLELNYIGGRTLPVRTLEYTHPQFKKVIKVGTEGSPGHGAEKSKPEGSSGKPAENSYDVDDGESGSSSYKGAQVLDLGNRPRSFDNHVKVVKERKEVERKGEKQKPAEKKAPTPKTPRVIQATMGERAAAATLPPLEFKTMSPVPWASMGDLEALDETVRHMRDALPDAQFSMGLVPLKQGRVVSIVDSKPRVAMVVTIRNPRSLPVILIDVERSGIAALSLMSMRFEADVTSGQMEMAVRKMLDGWVDASGYWSSKVEEELASHCHCQRLPKAIMPREDFEKYGKAWASRLVEKLGLMRDDEQSVDAYPTSYGGDPHD
ncbi:hypothetical protein [Thermomonas sp. HDW16]|uniref:hypothetical protein n=1 Tax=Thermomonas sp. HDW16 TaxID=2714945 RepID=UPI001409DB19|nr:hypothetical protein [Thermomonas sp. HDW16]QIL19766.1 hypothetical protein G7079_02935 [Thermomonas sp. HDW16]